MSRGYLHPEQKSRIRSRKPSRNKSSQYLAPDTIAGEDIVSSRKSRKSSISGKRKGSRDSYGKKRGNLKQKEPLLLDHIEDTLDIDSDNDLYKGTKLKRKYDPQGKPPKIHKYGNDGSLIKGEKAHHLISIGSKIPETEEESMRTLFKGAFMPPPMDAIHKRGSSRDRESQESEEPPPHIKNFATGEGILPPGKPESSITVSQIVEDEESKHDKSEKSDANPHHEVKINPLF
jgi:hypothetical protein